MSVRNRKQPEHARPVDHVRGIEKETVHLEQTIDQAREAVQRARRANSMAAPGAEHSVSEAEPRPEGVERPAADAPEETENPAEGTA